MQTARLYVLVAVCSSAWLISGCAATSPTPIAATAEAARITVLYDATFVDTHRILTGYLGCMTSEIKWLRRRPASNHVAGHTPGAGRTRGT